MSSIIDKMTDKATNEALSKFINSLHDQLDEELEKRSTEDNLYDYLSGANDLLGAIENFLNNNK